MTYLIAEDLRRTDLAFRAELGSTLRNLWMTAPQYWALATIQDTPKIHVAELALRCGVTRQTMTPIVEHLQQRSWVSREPAFGDDRIQILRTTNLGNLHLRWCRELAWATEERMLRSVSRAEREALGELLRLCRRNLIGSRPPHQPERWYQA